MQGSEIHELEIVFLLLLLVVVVFAALARRLNTPYPIVLVIAGLAVSFIPGVPRVILNPDVIFLVVLPPLLYAAAWVTSWRDFRYNLVSILFLAFGLVGFTAVGVAETTRWLFRGFDWRLGFVLGAVVATTDAIAATSIAKRVGLPRRIVDVLEGESLVNDATGLLALEFAIAMVVRGQTPSLESGVGRMFYLVVAGLAVGLISGFLFAWLERHIDDAQIEIVAGVLVPYAVYLGAEAIRASGVLAVVAGGLYLSRQSSEFFSPSVRLKAWAVWDSLTFAINGVVFVLIGLQLPYVLAGLKEYSLRSLLLYGALFSAIVIVLRLAWTYPGAYLAYFIRIRMMHQATVRPSAKQIFVVGWTGMRGVVALAAAIALPVSLDDGRPFPERNLIIFLTFSVIFVTLVLQGLTLPPLIRALGLAGTASASSEREEREARRIVARAALEHLRNSRLDDLSDFADIYEDLERRYGHRLEDLTSDGPPEPNHARAHARYRTLLREALRVERETVVRLRNDGTIGDEALRNIERELDLSETRLALS